MARRTDRVVITNEGRDKGKVFILTEMPSEQGEAWATRALLALVRGGGAEIPEDLARMGWLGLAAAGITSLGGLRYEELQPLMREMMGCVQIETQQMPQVTRAIQVEDDIEEVSTRLILRERLLDLHVGFSVRSILSALQARALAMKTTDGTTPTTQTAQTPSDLSSAAA